jgi:hypothetical protein
MSARVRVCLSILLASEDMKDKERNRHNIGFANLHSKYISFKYKPKLVFLQFVVNFGGLLGLWHGISLNYFTITTINFIKRKLFAYIRIRKLWTYFAVLNLFKKILKYFELQVKTFKTLLMLLNIFIHLLIKIIF